MIFWNFFDIADRNLKFIGQKTAGPCVGLEFSLERDVEANVSGLGEFELEIEVIQDMKSSSSKTELI